MSDKNLPAEVKKNAVQEVHSIGAVDFFDASKLNAAINFASQIAASDFIPVHYRKKPANVLTALIKAKALNMDPISLMEVSYSVSGKLAYEAKFVMGRINLSGKFKGPLQFKFSGEIKKNPDGKLLISSTRECTAWAVHKETGDKLEQSIPISMAFSEGWVDRNPKWTSMTDIMLQYRSASFFGKMYCPELTMGMMMRDEVEDIPDAEYRDEESEFAKELFEKGVQGDEGEEVAPLDPSKEVKAAVMTEKKKVEIVEVVAPVQVQQAPLAIEKKVEAVQVDLSQFTDENPPKMPEFKAWAMKRFETEATPVDSFFVKTRWIAPGESFIGFTDTQFAEWRNKWSIFLQRCTVFKKAV